MRAWDRRRGVALRRGRGHVCGFLALSAWRWVGELRIHSSRLRRSRRANLRHAFSDLTGELSERRRPAPASIRRWSTHDPAVDVGSSPARLGASKRAATSAREPTPEASPRALPSRNCVASFPAHFWKRMCCSCTFIGARRPAGSAGRRYARLPAGYKHRSRFGPPGT